MLPVGRRDFPRHRLCLSRLAVITVLWRGTLPPRLQESTQGHFWSSPGWLAARQLDPEWAAGSHGGL